MNEQQRDIYYNKVERLMHASLNERLDSQPTFPLTSGLETDEQTGE